MRTLKPVLCFKTFETRYAKYGHILLKCKQKQFETFWGRQYIFVVTQNVFV